MNEPLTVNTEDGAATVRPTYEVDVPVMEEVDWVSFCNVRDARRSEGRLRRGLRPPVLGRV